MRLKIGTKIRVIFNPSGIWFKDQGKIGTMVGYCEKSYYYIYIPDSYNNKGYTDRQGNKYTWIMPEAHFKPLGQVQLVFPFMEGRP